MPYITSQRVSEIRKEIKAKYPDFKFSITRRDHMCVDVTILSAPFPMLCNNRGRNHEEVYSHAIDRDYNKDIAKILKDIFSIMNAGNGILTEDADYGKIPEFYTSFYIGSWDKGFQVTEPIKKVA